VLNLGPEKVLVVLVVALIVLGPEKLPQAARTVGTAYRELRRITGGLQAEVRDVFSEPLREMRSAFDEPAFDEPAFDEPVAPGAAPESDATHEPAGASPPPPPGPSPVPFRPGDPSLN